MATIIIHTGENDDIIVERSSFINDLATETPEEEDKRTLEDRIKECIEDYGCVCVDRETAEKFFNAKWDDFQAAILNIINEDPEKYKINSHIEKRGEE